MAGKKRKRKRRPRPQRPAAEATPAPPAPSRRRRPAADERPPAPWGSFPLVELAVLIGIVLIVAGFIAGGGTSPLLLFAGIGLASLGGLELAIREHFSGFRSHTLLLSGIPAVATMALLFYAAPSSLPPLARVGIAAAVFAASAYGLVTMFRRKAGVSVKLR